LVIGGGLSLGLAHCLDSLSHRFKTAEDVKKHLELPVLASLPQLKP
jgi:capsular polysaccharide biosynthesis protein